MKDRHGSPAVAGDRQMRWFRRWWHKPKTDRVDEDTVARIKKVRDSAEQQTAASAELASQSKTLRERTGQDQVVAKRIKANNHFGESLAASYRPKHRFRRA
jgi:hypothetical protein